MRHGVAQVKALFLTNSRLVYQPQRAPLTRHSAPSWRTGFIPRKGQKEKRNKM
jgi:hypothetical protein